MGKVKLKSHLVPLKNVDLPEILKTDEEPKYGKGHALPEKRKNRRFTTAEKEFMRNMFNQGQLTKQKVNGMKTHSDMRKAVDSDGNKMFFPPYLTAEQIDAFFSKCYGEIKNKPISDNADDDSEEVQILNQERLADEQAIVLDAVNEELLNQVAQDNTGSNSIHPLEEDHINLCEIALNYLANRGNTKKLFLHEYPLAAIHSIFEKLDIPLPRKIDSYRALAKSIYKYVSATCPDKCTNL